LFAHHIVGEGGLCYRGTIPQQSVLVPFALVQRIVDQSHESRERQPLSEALVEARGLAVRAVPAGAQDAGCGPSQVARQVQIRRDETPGPGFEQHLFDGIGWPLDPSGDAGIQRAPLWDGAEGSGNRWPERLLVQTHVAGRLERVQATGPLGTQSPDPGYHLIVHHMAVAVAHPSASRCSSH